MNDTRPPVCSYEGSRYSTEFWNTSRAYEDGAERVAMRAMLPPTGRTLMEIGAGFGRLADLYSGYDTVVLFDYAETQLEQAVARLGQQGPSGKPKYIYVKADFYKMPFVSGLFDTVTMVRTLHHAVDAPAVLKGVASILAPSGAFVLEFANKHNLKALARYLLGRQDWSPLIAIRLSLSSLTLTSIPAGSGSSSLPVACSGRPCGRSRTTAWAC